MKSKPKKLLLICYYWPPSGGGGVQRWLFFIRHLEALGWDCTVYTVNSSEYPTTDNSLEEYVPKGVNVIRSDIWEPFDLYRKFTGKSKDFKVQASFANNEKGNRWLEKLAIWVRSNFFIPDARKFWIQPSIKRLASLHKTDAYDVVISSGPPHSAHLIALGLKNQFGLPWLADFRDPWTGIDYFEQLSLSGWALKKHQRLERKVLQKADAVCTVGKTLAEELGAIAKRKVEVITNGYPELLRPSSIKNQVFTIVHVGTLGPARNHPIFWQALKTLVSGGYPFKVQLIGKNDASVMSDIDKHGLKDYVETIDYIGSDEVKSVLTRADALYLPVNESKNAKGILTGKFFEYLSAQKPVIAIGPLDGDVNEILEASGAGKMFDFKDKQGLEAYLYDLLEGRVELRMSAESIENYSREAGAKKVHAILEQVLSSQ